MSTANLIRFVPQCLHRAPDAGVSILPDPTRPRPARDRSKFCERLDTLTPADEERMKQLREEWIKHALSTEPLGVEGAINGIIETYRESKMPEPRQVLWARSPLEGVVYAFFAHLYADGLDALRFNEPCPEIDDNMSIEIPAVPAKVDPADASPANFHDLMNWYAYQLIMGIRDSALADPGVAGNAELEAQITRRADVLFAWMMRELSTTRAELAGKVRDQLACIFWGSHEASWMSFYSFFEPYFEFISAVLGLIEIAKHAGWTWFYHGIAIVSERPMIIERDAQMRLHNENGPALGYRDGFGVYMLSGIRIEPYIINHPDQITFDKVKNEQNVEIRRLMVKQMGYTRFIQESGAKEIDSSRFGTLYHVEIEGDEPYALLEVINSTLNPDGTRERYFLRVPPTCTTAHEAVAWTSSRTVATYNPVRES